MHSKLIGTGSKNFSGAGPLPMTGVYLRGSTSDSIRTHLPLLAKNLRPMRLSPPCSLRLRAMDC